MKDLFADQRSRCQGGVRHGKPRVAAGDGAAEVGDDDAVGAVGIRLSVGDAVG